ncbi:TPA: hypothetical protein ACKFCW_002978 [Citrobacter farmeri]|nr:hypothetical protein [Pseudomonas sp.]
MSEVNLPRWQCHKVVQAAKILTIFEGGLTTRIVVEGGLHFDVNDAWLAKHEPARGGYFVRYEDGYESYSPAATFEMGYTPLNQAEVPASMPTSESGQ